MDVPAGLTILKACRDEAHELRTRFLFDAARVTRPNSVRAAVRAAAVLGAALDEGVAIVGGDREQADAERGSTGRLAELADRVLGLCVGLRAWQDCDDPEAWAPEVALDDPPTAAPTDRREPRLRAAAGALAGEHPALAPALAEAARPRATAGPASSGAEVVAPAQLLGAAACAAVELLDPVVRELGRWWSREEAALFYGDDDKPRTEAEMEARDLWQSGDLWIESGRRFAKKRGKGEAVRGSGPYAALVGATVGHDAREHVAAVSASDPRVFGLKRRSRTREFFRSPTKGPDYSNALPPTDVRRIYDAVAYANRCGVVLNARVTISWFLLEACTKDECIEHFDAFKKNVVQWLRHRGAAAPGQPFPAYVYAHEAVGGDRRHTHMRLAVPPELGKEFREEVRAALRHVIAPRPWPEPTVGPDGKEKNLFVVARLSSAVPTRDPGRSRPVTTDQWTGVRYMLKGADPRPVLAKRHGGQAVTVGDIIGWEYEDPGAPWRKRRVGASLALGRAARRAFMDEGGAPFHSLLELQAQAGTVDVRDLYSDYHLDLAAGRRDAGLPVQGVQQHGEEEDVVDALGRL